MNMPDMPEVPAAKYVAMSLRFDPIDATYINHLLKYSPAHARHALKIARKMANDHMADSNIMMLLTQISEWADDDGNISVYQWGRDCDQMEADHVYLMVATIEAYDNAVEQMFEQAEGPCYLHFISPEHAAEYVPYRRDHAAEQMGY
jgi:hypothetical protein